MHPFASVIARPHPQRVARLASTLAEVIDLSPNGHLCLVRGALLHDVGKELLPSDLVDKPGALTDGERRVMQQHTTLGARLAVTHAEAQPVVDVIRHHHERWDGRGYPAGLAGERIPLAARIVSVCDAYDAMTEDRPYRRARAPIVAIAELEAHAGAQFDPRLVDAFIASVVHISISAA
jgi:putative nucleotidyltransferase with HDIG domain